MGLFGTMGIKSNFYACQCAKEFINISTAVDVFMDVFYFKKEA